MNGGWPSERPYELLAVVADEEPAEAVLALAADDRGQRPPAPMMALRIPSVPPEDQTPSIFGSDGSCCAVLRCAVAESHMPVYLETTLIPGYFLKTSCRALVAVGVGLRTGHARDHDHIALALELVGDVLRVLLTVAAYWLPLILIAHGAVTRLSYATTRMLRAQACWMMPFRPVPRRR